ncbi:MAG: hypothetical protein NTW38_09060 [Candidatus Aminicenantes bacterium]|nr:hypothetical protein [Candidatus Aminicenantes bacterium]
MKRTVRRILVVVSMNLLLLLSFSGSSMAQMLTQDTLLRLPGGAGTTTFMKGTQVVSNPRGEVISGTLAAPRQKKVAGGGTVLVNAGALVTLNNEGEVNNAAGGGQADPSVIVGTWKNTDHIHQGCRVVENFCKAYKFDLLFSKEPNGALKAQLVGQPQLVGQQFFMVGYLQGQTWNFSATMNGNPHGNGYFEFSPDFKSFKGEFTDINGHHVVWTGNK